MNERSVCVHLHCYQPPRENPWTGVVEPEMSALPHRDWNERITSECYRPNGAARLLDHDGKVVDMVDNFAQTSWDIGPTLHHWLEEHAPDVDLGVRAADRRATAMGRPAAMAAPAIHAILPLATDRAKDTLMAWGLADFRRRFGRAPLGCWLPECAVDLPTLEALVDHGIRYTVLTPEQAQRVRRPGGQWVPVDAESLDTNQPYFVRLPSGRSIAVCFAHGRVSRSIAFDGLLSDGIHFARAIREAFTPDPRPQLVAIVTDGETFGHHHRFGEMALAWALRHLAHEGVRVTTFDAYLVTHPPVDEVEIIAPSSWSCAHGVERWRSDCGCVTGGQPGWNQRWRTPLRDAIGWLGGALEELHAQHGGQWWDDPWAVRNDFGRVIAGSLSEGEFLADHGGPAPAGALLHAQHLGLAASTSCAWFFADPAGIETGLALRYAARAMELAETATGARLEPEFRRRLAPMVSNDPHHGDAAALWTAHVEHHRPPAPSAGAGMSRARAAAVDRDPATLALRTLTLALREAAAYDHDTHVALTGAVAAAAPLLGDRLLAVQELLVVARDLPARLDADDADELALMCTQLHVAPPGTPRP